MREVIRPMKLDELETVMGWAHKEGWNPGKYDYKAYYSQDTSGFLVLCLNEKPIGSVSVVKYSEHHAFIGLFIVMSEYRNKGYGKKLWNYAMELIKGYANTSLYSVLQQVNRYQKKGFFGENLNHRWQLSHSTHENLSHLNVLHNSSSDILQQMIEYDARFWGSSRFKFFSKILKQPQSFAFVSFGINKNVNGYAVIRACMNGYRATIYSDTLNNAKKLTRLIISKVPLDSNIIFDIPTENKFSNIFADFFGLAHIDGCDTRIMYHGEKLEKGDEKCYGLASLEIG